MYDSLPCLLLPKRMQSIMIGGSGGSLPVYSNSASHKPSSLGGYKPVLDTDDNKYFSKKRAVSSLAWLATLQQAIQTIVDEQQTKKVFYFLLLNTSFTFVEFFYGYVSNSLGLTGTAMCGSSQVCGDSFILDKKRMLFTCFLTALPLSFPWVPL